MPQMSPLMWMNLFILFIMLFLFAMIKIYFFSVKELSLKENNLSTNPNTKLNWKW